MSTKTTRAGKRYSGKHTTVIPLAGEVCDIAEKLPVDVVKKISLNIIRAGLRRGPKRVKIRDEGTRAVVTIKDVVCMQKIFIFGDVKEISFQLKNKLEEKGHSVVLEQHASHKGRAFL